MDYKTRLGHKTGLCQTLSTKPVTYGHTPKDGARKIDPGRLSRILAKSEEEIDQTKGGSRHNTFGLTDYRGPNWHGLGLLAMSIFFASNV